MLLGNTLIPWEILYSELTIHFRTRFRQQTAVSPADSKKRLYYFFDLDEQRSGVSKQKYDPTDRERSEEYFCLLNSKDYESDFISKLLE